MNEPQSVRVPAQRVWDLSELYISSVDAARLLYADDGRPLGERYAPPRVRADVPFEMRRCPYSGSRRGYEMNVSGLRGVQMDWPRVLPAVDELRSAFLQLRPGPLDWGRIWIYGRTIASLPVFLAHSSSGRSQTVIPRVVSSLFKPALGLGMTAEEVLLAGGLPTDAPSAAEFVGHAEDKHVLVTRDAACSGPTRYLVEFIEHALGERSSEAEDRWIWDAVDVEALLRYGWANAELEVAKYRLVLSLALQASAETARFGVTLEPTYHGISLSDFADALDAEVVRHGFDTSTCELGRTQPFPLEGWLAHLGSLLGPVVGAVGAALPQEGLSRSDLEATIVHLRDGWRSGLEQDVPLARVSITAR